MASSLKQAGTNQGSLNPIPRQLLLHCSTFTRPWARGRSTAGLAAMDGGHAVELSGTILAMRQTALICTYLFQALTLVLAIQLSGHYS